MEHEKQKKLLYRLSSLLLLGLFIFLIFVKFIPLITPFMIALLFAFLINPLVDFFETRLKVNRKLSSAIVLLILFFLLVLILIISVTELYSLGEDLVSNLMLTANFEGLSYLSEKLYFLFGLDLDLVEGVKNLIMPLVQGMLSVIKNIAVNVPQAFISTIVFVLATYFLVADKERIMTFLYRILKEKNARWVLEIRNISKRSISKYVKAQLTMMVITFCELTIGFTVMELIGIVDLKYIFLLALGIAVIDALPVFGTGAVLIPWALYGVLMGQFDLAAALLILYVVCLTVRQFVEPKVVGESLGLHPLVTLLSMFLGLKLIGIGGMILFPILALLLIQLNRAGAFDRLKEFF